ncbi:PIG-L deacetylase family protein [Chryseolinea sp. H1M3-3]|uniref:PIG-L deacetylase family protein n=1 Tax=Chryseolinea sp. H1M3-3 TaxID=3034144 RepID=UPI0023EBB618|nr:PIG-L deacetylase family protein [Chryseolinea sp. H1M3-3]
MLSVDFGNSKKLNLLLLGAHCDDIEIGCGGTLLRLVEENKIEHVKWVVFASTAERKKEAIDCAEFFLRGVESKEIVVLNFEDTILNESKSEIKNVLVSIKNNFSPDLIFTHHRHDLHQDHKLLSELTWNIFRNHLVLEYEIPKYDGDLGHPNFFITLEERYVTKKIKALLNYYVSQKQKHWFDNETFVSLLRVRGLEIASPTRYAEAFHVKKVSF